MTLPILLASRPMQVPSRRPFQLRTALLTIALAACSSPADVPTVASVSVSPGSSSALVGESVTFTAAARDASGAVISDRSVTWRSSAPAVAAVTNGVATAVTGGTALIIATIDGVEGSAQLTVRPPVASVVVSPATNSVAVGGTVSLAATTRDAAGATLSDRAITWTSSNNSIATVSSAGVVSVVSFGPAVTITATSEGRSGSAVINIIPPVASVTVTPATATLAVGASTTLTAVTRDPNGNVLTGQIDAWVTSNSAVATVAVGSTGTGIVTAVAPGTVTVEAVAGGRRGSAQITVTLAPVTANGLTLDGDSLPVGGATVEFWQNGVSLFTVTSDAQGRFSRPGVLPGAYELRVRRFGYLNAAVPVTVTTAGTLPSVLLRLEERPIAGVARLAMISRGGGTYVFEADIFVLDATGQLVSLSPSAFTMPSTRFTFQSLTTTTGMTSTLTNTSTLMAMPYTGAMFSADTARYRLRLARELARQTTGGGHLLGLGAFGPTSVFSSRDSVLSNGFSGSGVSLFPGLDLLGTPVSGSSNFFTTTLTNFLNYIVANTPLSSRSVVLLTEDDEGINGGAGPAVLQQYLTQGVRIHTVAITTSTSNREQLAQMSTRTNGISMPITDFRQLEAAKVAIPRLVRGGLPYYRLRWTSVGSASAAFFTETLQIQLPTGVLVVPMSLRL
jgi:uncharacterized protein YjdB